VAGEPTPEAAKKPAPPGLALVQDYVNTTKRLYGQEGLTSPYRLRRWLIGHRLLERNDGVTTDDLRDAIDLREALRGLMLTNTIGGPNAGAVEMFNRIAGRAVLRAHLGADATPAIEPCTGGVPRGFGMIASTALLAMIDGSWQRLKACANADCQWSFYDRSPSGSGTWCEMAVCGSRAKMRAYRQRRSAADRPRAHHHF